MKRAVEQHNIRTALVIVWFALTLPLFAQDVLRGRLRGTVLDAETQKPLYGANVMVKETVLGSATGIDGSFVIERVPLGVFDVEATMIGYERQLITDVQILPGLESRISFRLKPSIVQGPSLIVTATKRKQAIEDAPTSVDVLGKEEIQARSPVTLDEVLQNTAGFGVIKGQIDLRGSTGFNWSAGSRVLFMVDGHPLISGDNGGISWDAVPVEEVERVEVVKGAGSALYGSNAMAGMVNVILRDPSPIPMSRVKLSWGFYDKPAYEAWRWTDRFLTQRFNPFRALSFETVDISHSRQLGKLGLLFTAGRKRSSGYSQNGEYSRWNAMAKLHIPVSPSQTLDVTANYASNLRGEFFQWVSKDRPLELPSEEIGDKVYSEKKHLHATFKHLINDKWVYTVKSNLYRNHWENRYHNNSDWATTDRIGTEVQVDYITGKQNFTFGSEITNHHAKSLIYGNRDTWDIAFYAEDELKLHPAITLTVGARYDRHWIRDITADGQLSPRLGLVYRPLPSSSLRFSVGRGFRAPSIAEVFANIAVAGLHVVPNPDLKDAEKAWSAEIAVRQVLDFASSPDAAPSSFFPYPLRWIRDRVKPSLILDLAFFWSRYRNMIDVEINSALTAVQFMNTGEARNQGMEFRARLHTFDGFLTASFGYTLLDPVNLETGKTLNYRSRHRVVTGLEIKSGRIRVGWDYRYASRIEEIVNIFGSGFDERVPMHVMDGRIIYDLQWLEIALEGRNLGNYHYTLRQRFLEPLRHFFITLRGSF